MIFCTQRLARNDFGWQRPSPKRLGRHGEGEYVQAHGFGHEDWNFNTSLASDGYVYGYVYYSPAATRLTERFNFAFLTWDDGRWHLVGFWLQAEHCPDGAPKNARVNEAKAEDLTRLADDLGADFSQLSRQALLTRINHERRWLRWRVKVQDIQVLADPLALPATVYESAHYRITKPKFIERRAWNRLFDLARTTTADSERTAVEVDMTFAEGRGYTAVHFRRERSASLVAAAKANFLRKHGRLFCEVCDFDFARTYGERAEGLVEAHHVVPLSELEGVTKVTPDDLALLCANCHRVIHFTEPWLTIPQLRTLLSEARSKAMSNRDDG